MASTPTVMYGILLFGGGAFSIPGFGRPEGPGDGSYERLQRAPGLEISSKANPQRLAGIGCLSVHDRRTRLGSCALPRSRDCGARKST